MRKASHFRTKIQINDINCPLMKWKFRWQCLHFICCVHLVEQLKSAYGYYLLSFFSLKYIFSCMMLILFIWLNDCVHFPRTELVIFVDCRFGCLLPLICVLILCGIVACDSHHSTKCNPFRLQFQYESDFMFVCICAVYWFNAWGIGLHI